MKRTLSLVMAVCFFVSAMAMTTLAAVNPFVDVPEDAWYHDEVVKAVETGIINGKNATEFKPDDLLTYAEAAKLAACMNQVYTTGSVSLKNGDPWYKPYVDYCKENNIIFTDYNYEENATRGGYMMIFANALPDSAFADLNKVPDGSILDVKNNAPYAIYVYKLYRAGIVTGVDAFHNCKPDDNIKRSEVAAIISRMMDEQKRVEFEMPGAEETPKAEEKPETEVKTEDAGKDNQKTDEIRSETDKENENEKDSEKDLIIEENPVNIEKIPTVVVKPEEPKIDVGTSELTLSILSIAKQPEGLEAESYGVKAELEVQVYGGKPPYTYEWQYKVRRENVTVKNGDYVEGAESAILVLSVEKDNILLGEALYCKITDSEGAQLTSDSVKVYGPFSMPVDSDSVIVATKEYELVGRIADGIIRKGDKVSVERNGKIIATGVAKDMKMFNKSIDECVKGDNIGLVFELGKGVKPTSGDIVIKYKDTHVIDTSDIVN